MLEKITCTLVASKYLYFLIHHWSDHIIHSITEAKYVKVISTGRAEDVILSP